MDCAKVGKLILQLRKEKGLTQKNVADALNISNKTISKWECGMGCPSHYISFVAYVADDKVLLNKLYPEQTSAVRFPIMRGNGKLYAYCNHHGLWEQSILD